MAVDRETVRRVGVLSRLEIGAQEETQVAQDMDKIINFIEQLQKIDVTDIPPTASVVPHDQPTRADTADPDARPEDLLDLAPERVGPYYAVPKVVE
ncbi:MAG: Asp-tRNA(Asn)/Glu-tRNA(Gln) amidotransferase subunit GatC [Pseudomonadota bacterium]